MVETIVSNLVGAAVTIAVAHVYFRMAGSELRNEAARLRHLSDLIIRSLENAGLARVTRGPHGEPTGLIVELRGLTVGGTGALRGSLNFDPPKKD